MNGELIGEKCISTTHSSFDNLLKLNLQDELTNLVQSNNLEPSTNLSHMDGKTNYGDVESVISVKSSVFSSNANSTSEYQKFLRRFVSTQVRIHSVYLL